MKKAQKTAKTRANRLAQRDRQLAKQKAEVEELEEAQEDPIPEESIEKDMGPMYYAGPTSFEEMDALKEAREQAAKVREVTWDTQDLVWNILNHPMMEPEAKAKAIQEVGSGFGQRVTQAAKPIKKDLDVLVIEAILAQDKRHSKPFEFIGDWISKAKLTAQAENALSDEQFALVTEQDGEKVRRYPIHDKSHVRKSLARAAQMISEGGEAATDAKKALPNIRAAAKKLGIEMSMEKDRNAIVIEKDANGDWRWIGWVSNNFLDWDGDIMSEESHLEYVDWLEKNTELSPLSTTWHLPEMVRKSAVDFSAYENGFLIMSGKLTEEEAEILLKNKALTDLGMSHGTFVLARDEKDPRVITKYRMYECSDLPLENAANPFTDFEILAKEADMDKKKYLAAFFGGDEGKADAFLEKTGLKQKALQDAGIESKEKAEEVPVTEPPAETPAETPTAKPDQKAIVEAVLKELGAEDLGKAFTELTEKAEKVDVLEALVKELQGEQEEKLAEMLTPPAARFPWMQKARATQSDDTVAEGEEETKLKAKAPGVPEGYWLNEITGTTPVQV